MCERSDETATRNFALYDELVGENDYSLTVLLS